MAVFPCFSHKVIDAAHSGNDPKRLHICHQETKQSQTSAAGGHDDERTYLVSYFQKREREKTREEYQEYEQKMGKW